ncbi:glycosyltransferase family 4 protein [Variovorax ginsengisoli]|uniref:Glycosyltransferase family 1 protein n=1 Tax=Variovorax ginsengisoli TaxID=363844 RepID=A0ABT8RVX2_9BURK|nr:glycosyltransferase family 1 protein [Variovorax ginsengisoli]MDN8611509.1 glycosyltransferase family 1 protein [Variovorax ginsengisoli]MDO1530679.1 glycosyltransferase family 1 protein [Variovorax ginsengisoli]
MKVLLVANYEPDAQNSMLAFRRVLERELPRLGCEVRVAAPPQRVLRFAPSARWRKWFAYIDKFVLFIPSLVRQARWADVVHVTDHSNGMYIPWLGSRPAAITCHDVIAIQAARGMVEGWHVGRSGRLFQRLIVRGLARADVIACVSDLTRRDLLALDLAQPSKVVLARNGLNDEFLPVPPAESQALLARLGLRPQEPYLLHVGADLPRKNRRRVLETFIALHERAAAASRPALVQRLVFVGPELGPELAQLAQRHVVADRITTLQGLSHAELRAAYAGATALLFPSLQEGFGWPVIEAQACGCPVFTSDLAPMNEIGGEGAVYVDPDDPVAMAEAIELATPRLAELRQEGLANAALYTPGQMAAAYVAAYRLAIEKHEAKR